MKDAKGHGSNSRGGRVAKPIPNHPYHRKSEAELRYIIKDAGEAARAMRGVSERAENKYADQVNDAATVLGYRDRGGKQDGVSDGDAARALASGPKSAPAPVHDGAAGRSDLSASIERGHAMRRAGDGGHVSNFDKYWGGSISASVAHKAKRG